MWGVTIVATIAAFARIGAESVWLDEAITVDLARSSWTTSWELVRTREANGSLYYLVMRGWLHFGGGETFIRLPAAVAAVACAPVLFLIVRRLTDRATATLAGLLLAVNAFFVAYAQEARMYSLAMLGACLTTLLFLRADESPTRSRCLTYGAVSGLALYTHFFVGLVLVVHALTFLTTGPLARLKHSHRRVVSGTAVTIVMAAPLSLFLWTAEQSQLDWIPRPDRGAIPDLFASLAGDGGSLLATMYAGFSVIGVAALLWRRSLYPAILLGAWLVVPIGMGFALSQARPLFLPRYLAVVVPALAALVAIGIRALPRKTLPVLVALAMLGFTIGPTLDVYRLPQKRDFRRTVDLIVDGARPGDGIILYTTTTGSPPEYFQTPVEYYILRENAEDRAPMPIYPATPWVPGFELGDQPTRLVADGAGRRPVIDLDAVADVERIWLVFFNNGTWDLTYVLGRPDHGFVPVTTESLSRIQIQLYERNETT